MKVCIRLELWALNSLLKRHQKFGAQIWEIWSQTRCFHGKPRLVSEKQSWKGYIWQGSRAKLEPTNRRAHFRPCTAYPKAFYSFEWPRWNWTPSLLQPEEKQQCQCGSFRTWPFASVRLKAIVERAVLLSPLGKLWNDPAISARSQACLTSRL